MENNYCYHCMQPMDAQGDCPHCQKGAYETPLHHLKPGTMLQDRYLIGKALGEGGFGITYIGRDTRLDARVAVKEYYPNGFSNRNHQFSNEVTLTQKGGQCDFESEMERFLNEARRLAKFRGEPGVVGVLEFFRENNTAYIVMEFLDGITMKQYLDHYAAFTPGKLFELMKPVMEALEMVHKEGLIHRDISPDNIMMLKNGKLKLLDFGAAREVGGDKSLSVVLKHGYAPAEQYFTNGKQGPWTDVYALCATMYKCITNQKPPQSLERGQEDELVAPSKLGVEISPSQEAALLKGLSVRAKERFQSVQELMQALQAMPQQTPIHNLDISSAAAKVPENKDDNTVAQIDDKTTAQVIGTQIAKVSGTAIAVSGDDQTVRDDDDAKNSKHNRHRKIKHDPVRKNKKLPLILGIGAGALVLIVALVFLLGGKGGKPPVPVTTVPGNDSFSLESVAQIQDPSRELEVDEQSLQQPGENGFAILNPLGQDVTGKVYTDVEYLDEDLFLVRQNTGTVNNGALMTREGEVLFEGVSLIAWPQEEREEHGRFLLVYDAKDKTENKEDYLICQTDNGRVYSSNTGGILYTGSIRIYDREAKTFVPNLPEITDEWDVEVCGNSLLIHVDSGTNLYDSTGKLLMELKDDYPEVGNGIFSYDEGSTYRVCDEKGNQLYYSNNYISVIPRSRYLQDITDGKSKVMDENGNQVLSNYYDTVTWFGDGMFLVRQDGKYGLIKENDQEFLPCAYDSITRIGRGYGYTNRGDVYDLFGPEGIVGVKMPYKATSLNYINDNGEAYVINRRDFAISVSESYGNEADHGLIIIKGSDRNLYGVLDLISGTQLLGYEYELIHSADGYLYAYKNGAWEVYRVHFSEGN